MNDALGGLGGVNSIRGVRLDDNIRAPDSKKGDENENSLRYQSLYIMFGDFNES